MVRVWVLEDQEENQPGEFAKMKKTYFSDSYRYEFTIDTGGYYYFICALPYDLNVKGTLVLEKLKLHERLRRLSTQDSRFSMQVKLKVWNRYANIFEKNIVLDLASRPDYFEGFEVPPSYCPANVSVHFKAFSLFRALRVVASMHLRPGVSDRTGDLETKATVSAIGKKLLQQAMKSDVYDPIKEDELMKTEQMNGANANPNNNGTKKKTNNKVPKCIITSDHCILTDTMRADLAECLPFDLKHAVWVQRYSMTRNGASSHALIRSCKSFGPEPQILVMKDGRNVVFGGFLRNGFYQDPYKFSGSYSEMGGEGESFVFTFKTGSLEAYKWTGKNRFFRIVGENGLGMGGGGEGFAFFVDEGLDDGTSQRSATYDNKVLSGSSIFYCIDTVLWALETVMTERKVDLAFA